MKNTTIKTLYLLLVLLLFTNRSFSQNIYLSTSTDVSFFSEARLENIEAHSTKATSAINISSNAIAFKVPIQSFKFGNGLMQEHFNENYMESDKYPDATFIGKITEEIDLSQEGEYKVNAVGKLTMHGIAKERTIPGTLTVKGGKIQLTSSFIVPVSDHKIDIPNDKLTNISQNISVKIKALYEPKK
jgi:polyisoprenoid-binding protein YceI